MTFVPWPMTPVLPLTLLPCPPAGGLTEEELMEQLEQCDLAPLASSRGSLPSPSPRTSLTRWAWPVRERAEHGGLRGGGPSSTLMPFIDPHHPLSLHSAFSNTSLSSRRGSPSPPQAEARRRGGGSFVERCQELVRSGPEPRRPPTPAPRPSSGLGAPLAPPKKKLNETSFWTQLPWCLGISRSWGTRVPPSLPVRALGWGPEPPTVTRPHTTSFVWSQSHPSLIKFSLPALWLQS